MLVMFVVALSLSAVAIFAAAKVTRTVMDRFGLDGMTTLLRLGLAEWPSERRVVVDRPARRRRRSAHPPPMRSARRRQPVTDG